MSKVELEEWEQRYADKTYSPRQAPSTLLASWLTKLPRGRALDLACGYGRNALFLAQHGYIVDAIDISRNALLEANNRANSIGLHVNWIQADLEQFCLPEGVYNVVVSSFCPDKTQAPHIATALAPLGLLIYEFHLRTSEPVDGPQGDKDRLKPGELPSLFPSLSPLFYDEGIVQMEGRKNALARLVAYRKA